MREYKRIEWVQMSFWNLNCHVKVGRNSNFLLSYASDARCTALKVLKMGSNGTVLSCTLTFVVRYSRDDVAKLVTNLFFRRPSGMLYTVLVSRSINHRESQVKGTLLGCDAPFYTMKTEETHSSETSYYGENFVRPGDRLFWLCLSWLCSVSPRPFTCTSCEFVITDHHIQCCVICAADRSIK
jgi:hypothetical protein